MVSASNGQTAGVKRKLTTATSKFYGVRRGKTPGVYFTWADCLAQVQGFPKAFFKSFTTLTEADKFVQGGDDSNTKPTKFYAVQAGRAPGVYTDYEDVLDQITGWKGSKHKSFPTRTEAEQFVAAGTAPAVDETKPPITTTNDITSMSAPENPSPPSTKKLKTAKPRKSLPKDDPALAPPIPDQGEYPAGEAPLPPSATDGFDPTIILSHTTNTARYKTRTERDRHLPTATAPLPSAPIRIYTDGSALSNGRANAVAGVGVYFGPSDARNVSEPLAGTKQTNQRAELMALVRALEAAPRDRKVVVVSDSKYAIDCVTVWFVGWRKKGWTGSTGRAVENRDLVQRVLDLLEERVRVNRHRVGGGKWERDGVVGAGYWDRGPGGVRFEWVKGHAKDVGNEAADGLAVAGARTALELSGEVEVD